LKIRSDIDLEKTHKNKVMLYKLYELVTTPFRYFVCTIKSACQSIKRRNNLVAIETSRIIDSGVLSIRSLNSINNYEYVTTIRSPDDPLDHRDFLSRLVGLFVSPTTVFVDTTLCPLEVERTIVHEVQHYRNHCDNPDLDPVIDEQLAIEAEDRYSGRYITRQYMRKLKVYVDELFTRRKNVS
jgi:hypothetical protein